MNEKPTFRDVVIFITTAACVGVLSALLLLWYAHGCQQ